MAGLFYSSSKPTSSSSSSSPPSSPYSRLLLLVTLLPLSLACFAFVLQWRGGLDDPVTHWSTDHREFPGMASTHEKKQRSLRGRSNSDSGCVDLLGVFSSVVTSAHMSLNNSSTVSISRESSQVTGRRRVLESHPDIDTESQASAIPPQSPPGLEATQPLSE
ncbi:hypothetical protein F2Q70_00041038 [Brassica cretica]|uniref:Uncharacterized protein n=1 Tax=Brassica cretica TaxID=69181 RepID=A0A8S9KDF0_BRACR|nr:hypothetical protein F2Q70_00041038 [Brassica cretica]